MKNHKTAINKNTLFFRFLKSILAQFEGILSSGYTKK